MLKKFSAIIGVVASLVMASPALGQEVRNSRMIGDWFLAELHSPSLGGPQCLASTNFPDGTKLELTLATGGGGFRVSLENADWTSLNTFDTGQLGDRRMPVTLIFTGTEHSWSAPFIVLKESRFNRTPRISSGFVEEQLSETVLAFAQASSLTVRNDSAVIGEYSMAGSTAAMGALVGCMRSILAERERREGNDPFRQN